MSARAAEPRVVAASTPSAIAPSTVRRSTLDMSQRYALQRLDGRARNSFWPFDFRVRESSTVVGPSRVRRQAVAQEVGSTFTADVRQRRVESATVVIRCRRTG
jgi:hypothetical protein